MESRIELILCYAQEDESIVDQLMPHLGVLKRQGFFRIWYAREISAGTNYAQEKDKHLRSAHIIVLIISQYFLNSDYCYRVEMEQAIERHDRGEARVIPVLLRRVYYEKTPFAKLESLPKNSKFVLEPGWYSLDEALFEVAEGIREVAEELLYLGL